MFISDENVLDSIQPELFVDPFSLSASEHNISAHLNSQPAAGTATSLYPHVTDADEHSKLAAFDSLGWLYCFMLDDLCYSVLKQPRMPTLLCPKHGEQNAREIAPDLAFEDIDTSLLISDASALVIDSLLGRGSFGSVFRGSLGPYRVAVKVLENLKQAPTVSRFPLKYDSD